MSDTIYVEEAIWRLESEMDSLRDEVEGDGEKAAYWWNRITGHKAEAHGWKIHIEVDVEDVAYLLERKFDEFRDADDCDQWDMLPHFWEKLLSQKVEITEGEWGCSELVVVEDTAAK